MAEAVFAIRVPGNWRLKTIVFSHGWFHLPPFEWDARENTLSTVGRIQHRPATVRMHHAKRSQLQVTAKSKGCAKAKLESGAATLVRQMLNLDVDVEGFYGQAGESYDWARRIGAGPFLRSASMFEDAVKMLATTNCSWSLTRQMVSRLTDTLGETAPDGKKAFPTPERMAAQNMDFYRDIIRTGYRAKYFHEFAKRVDQGEIQPESWATFAGPTDELIRKIRESPGIGRYAAENLCKLLGRFDGLALDSWCLQKFPQVHGPVRGDVAEAIAQRYRRHGRWQGLALWLDLTRDWHESSAFDDETVSFQKR